MKIISLTAVSLMLLGSAAIAQPRDDRRDDHRPAPPAHGPAMAARPVGGGPGRPVGNARPGPGFAGPRPGAHHLPPGIVMRGHDRAPTWRGRSFAIGDVFALAGFHSPVIVYRDYGLPPPRPGTHWIYVDGWYLMVGNRTGKIFDEVPADY
jgi:Ni/Co efflux regulator RcnB